MLPISRTLGISYLLIPLLLLDAVLKFDWNIIYFEKMMTIAVFAFVPGGAAIPTGGFSGTSNHEAAGGVTKLGR
ncbi:hypothetical protein [Neisseria iguanae]|uniref:Uncharacterized protein n=1 Tax=Neisseria iguanae TaxID=90242 RepID=A0A2P7TX10_9NEIS|nr:hypothetical protein [Neisseria iguanae]PSJ79278.1 hypothetical protein C7N83_13180 [Neisseria iguanae]